MRMSEQQFLEQLLVLLSTGRVDASVEAIRRRVQAGPAKAPA